MIARAIGCLLLLSGLLQPGARAMEADAARAGIGQLADELHQSLVNRQVLRQDLPLVTYCEALLDRLFPDHAGEFAVFATRDHGSLAFSLPNGHIYLSAGLFLLIKTEAELAFVLAHEAAHVLNSDSHRRLAQRSIPGRVPESAQFMTELEMKADRVAITQLHGAGLGLTGVGEFMQRLARTHGPSLTDQDQLKLGDRIGQLQILVAQQVFSNGKPIKEIIAASMETALQRQLNLGQWQAALDCLTGRCGDVLDPGKRQKLLAEATVIGSQWDQAGRAGESRSHRETGEMGSPDPGRRLSAGWVRVDETVGSLTLSRDGLGIQSLRLEIQGGEMLPAASPGDLADAVRQYRARVPEEYLQLLAHEEIKLGFWQGLSFDLQQRDENGLRWQTRVYRLGQPGRHLTAIYRAPLLYFFGRDIDKIEAIISALE